MGEETRRVVSAMLLAIVGGRGQGGRWRAGLSMPNAETKPSCLAFVHAFWLHKCFCQHGQLIHQQPSFTTSNVSLTTPHSMTTIQV
jgi:hypothetical protein